MMRFEVKATTGAGKLMVDVAKELERIVGAKYVSSRDYEKIAYSRDASGYPGKKPDYIARPGTTAETSEILRLANKYKIPVTPVGNRSASWGRSLASGGILLDLTRMKNIIIDEKCMACTVEPGVTNWELQAELKKRGLRLGTVPLSTGAATIIGNAVTVGHSPVYTGKFGWMADQVQGLEVVLPTGEIIRTGSWTNPHSTYDISYLRYAFGPDLSGIFLGSEGAFGVVTKMSLVVYPIPEVEKVVIYGFGDDVEAGKSFLYEGQLQRHLWSTNMLLWQRKPHMKRTEEELKPLERMIQRGMVDPATGLDPFYLAPKKSKFVKENKVTCLVVIEGSKEIAAAIEKETDHLAAKYDGVKAPPEEIEALNKHRKKWEKHEFNYGSGFPTTGRGALVWQIPPLDQLDFSEKIFETLKRKYGYDDHRCHPVDYIRVCHPIAGMTRAHVLIDERDPNDWEKAIRFLAELQSRLLEAGAVPYRLGTVFPRSFLKKTLMYPLLKKIKECLDPNGIMHPALALSLGASDEPTKSVPRKTS